MFDDFDDDDTTDLMPDLDVEFDADELRRSPKQKTRRMTVSEVSYHYF